MTDEQRLGAGLAAEWGEEEEGEEEMAVAVAEEAEAAGRGGHAGFGGESDRRNSADDSWGGHTWPNTSHAHVAVAADAPLASPLASPGLGTAAPPDELVLGLKIVGEGVGTETVEETAAKAEHVTFQVRRGGGARG